jgi:DNA-binding beta-propeller fold protein YncE
MRNRWSAGIRLAALAGFSTFLGASAAPRSGAALAAPSGVTASELRAHPSDPAPGSIPVSAGLLFVCNQDDASVAIIDIEAGEVVHTVDLQALGFSANARPHHIVVEPDGSHWYVSLIGEGLVAKLDREHRLVGTAEFETPGMLALHSEKDRLFVARSMSAVNPPPRIGIIRPSDMSIEEVEVFFPRPHALVLDPRTGIAYTASLAVNQIAAVDPETERAVVTDVQGPPHALMQWAISPDGTTLAISGEISHTVHLFDISANPLEPSHVGVVEVESQPFDPIFTGDGRTVWIGNKLADRITAIDVARMEVVTVLDDPRIRQPHGAALSADGRFVLISNTNVREPHDMMMMAAGDPPGHDHHPHHDPGERVVGGPGSVAIIDAESGTLVGVVQVGQNATGIAVTR